MIDIGLFQDPLFVQSEPEWWMKLFPGYHPVRVMVDTGLTTDLDTAASLGWGSGYPLVVVLLAIWGLLSRNSTDVRTQSNECYSRGCIQ